MKNIIVSIALLINGGATFAQNANDLILTSVDCKQNTCSSSIVNDSNEKLGEFFLSKKVNPESGVSIYTAETISLKEKLTDSNLIVCLKNHECQLFKSTEGFKADYAYLNNEFFKEVSLINNTKRQKRNTNKQSFIVRADVITMFEGNESLNIPFPNE